MPSNREEFNLERCLRGHTEAGVHTIERTDDLTIPRDRAVAPHAGPDAETEDGTGRGFEEDTEGQ